MSAVQLMWDALGDAETEVQTLHKEVTKLRTLLVRRLCDCRRIDQPLEPRRHRLTCMYRLEMQ